MIGFESVILEYEYLWGRLKTVFECAILRPSIYNLRWTFSHYWQRFYSCRENLRTDILKTIEGLYQITIHFSKTRFLPTPFDDSTRVNECYFFSSSLSPLLIRFRIRFWPSSKWSTCYGRGCSAVG